MFRCTFDATKKIVDGFEAVDDKCITSNALALKVKLQ